MMAYDTRSPAQQRTDHIEAMETIDRLRRERDEAREACDDRRAERDRAVSLVERFRLDRDEARAELARLLATMKDNGICEHCCNDADGCYCDYEAESETDGDTS